MCIHSLVRGEENKYQLEVREEMGQLENALLSAKRDCELLRIEFERTIASNEQAAPIAKELQVRNLEEHFCWLKRAHDLQCGRASHWICDGMDWNSFQDLLYCTSALPIIESVQ